MQRPQFPVDEAKVRLNLAVCLGVWPMLSSMAIKAESIEGYNNQLKKVQD